MSSKYSISVKNVDMPDFMQQDATELAIKAFEEAKIERDIAMIIKKEFDKKYSPTWHCIVGKSFGSHVTHETKSFIYFHINNHSVLLFKTG
ncbi:cytoplasmic dynein light chain [Tieghemostelium lacteum]|uniref:Dynein light chain n=1 Tax=Tieghemostelium lacteum TaxID=361077 RepID=A0A151ZDM6_TIELA|nr:cytoplasmic dynein light chain [Tieghemostelium lacteum]|eukprot:KYQ92041.1 cytoplasmic dynein light chain [Tieghemostelium lacteum]